MPERTARTPRTIAADARAQIDDAADAYVAVNLTELVLTMAEFMDALAATLPPDPPADPATPVATGG